MAQTAAVTALIVEGDKSARAEMRRGLLAGGFQVIVAENAVQGLEKAEKFLPDVIVSAVILPGDGGFSFWRAYARRFPHRTTPIVFVSSLRDAETKKAIVDAGADDFLFTPVKGFDLLKRVQAALERREQGEIRVVAPPASGRDEQIVTEERVGRGVFEIITFVETGQIVTAVTAEQKTVMQQTSPHPGAGRVKQAMSAQHADVQAALRDRIASTRMSQFPRKTRSSRPPRRPA